VQHFEHLCHALDGNQEDAVYCAWVAHDHAQPGAVCGLALHWMLPNSQLPLPSQRSFKRPRPLPPPAERLAVVLLGGFHKPASPQPTVSPLHTPSRLPQSDWLSSYWAGFMSPSQHSRIRNTGVPMDLLRVRGVAPESQSQFDRLCVCCNWFREAPPACPWTLLRVRTLLPNSGACCVVCMVSWKFYQGLFAGCALHSTLMCCCQSH